MRRRLPFLFALLAASALAYAPAPKEVSPQAFTTGDPNWPTEWRTEMELRPGARTLTATARHGSGMFTTNTSVTFTNNAVDQTTVSHFAEGQLSHRIWRNSLGQTNRVQTFTWDARSRLIATTEVDDQNNGYNWSAVYDALGRRLKTTTVIVTNGFALTNQPKVIASYFDPGVEFLELGVNVSGKARWKICGPDLNGSYGGMNGTGGYDGVVDDVGVVRPVVSDARGNVHGLFDTVELTMNWNGSRPTGYGAVPEYRPLSLSDNGDLGSASAWRGRWPDRSGLYWLGARYYDPVAGRFISCDPYGHDADPSLYAFADGDPVNFFDPDGRLGKGAYAGWTDASVPANASSAFMAGYYGGGVAGGFQEGWQGGQQIVANTFTFGGTDASGWTDTTQLQGWEYTGSRILATTGREALIGAATLGSFQMARYGSEGALYTYQGLQVMNAGRSGYAIGTGIDQVSQGNNWGYLNIGAGTLGLAGGFTMTAVAPELNAGVQTMRQGVAQGFYEAAGWAPDRIASHLNGVDFSQSVRVTTLPQGSQVIQYQVPGNPVGNYFAPVGTPATAIGVDPAGRVSTLFTAGQNTTVLQSTAASTAGNTAVPAAARGAGGGIQYFAPTPSTFLETPPRL